MTESGGLALVAAVEREVRPLIGRWHIQRRTLDGRSFEFYEDRGWALVCGGMGASAARRAAEAIIHFYRPACLASVGFAGALDESLALGAVVVPRRVIDAGDGSCLDTGRGEHSLLSFSAVAGAAQKRKLAAAYRAQAVDMEAAAVARAAQEHGLEFLAVKAISDDASLELAPLAGSIDAQGRFRQGRFLAAIAWQPWLWFRVFRLARSSARAARNLCRWLEQHGRPARPAGERAVPHAPLPEAPLSS